MSGRGAPAAPAIHVVAAHRTAATPAQIRKALSTAYRAQTGHAAAPAFLDVLTAHVSHETARGERMFNNNFGGIKGAGPRGDMARYATREVGAGGEDHHLVDGFRAYATPREGAADYLRVMKQSYGAALDAAARGDAEGFAAALKARGYFTERLEPYAASMRALACDPGANGRVAPPAPPDLPPLIAPPLVPPLPATADGVVTAGLISRIQAAVDGMSARIGAPLHEDRT